MEDKLQEIFDAHARGEHFSWSNCPLCWAQRQIREMLSAPMISSIVLFTLLSCGVVEAQQDLYTDCIHTAPDGTVYDICRMPDMRKILSESKSCEVKMKEVIRVMDRYLPHPEYLTDSTLEYCDDVCMAERALDAAKKQAAALAKWRTVYKECVQ